MSTPLSGHCLFLFPKLMHSNIFLDESGDLGWTFNKPYRSGGSSKYLTIGYLINPATHCNIPPRLVRNFYNRFNFNPKKEIKASELKSHHKEYIANEAVKMLEKYPDFSFRRNYSKKIKCCTSHKNRLQ